MSRSRTNSTGNKSSSSGGDLIIVENHFYSPSPSSLDNARRQEEEFVERSTSSIENGNGVRFPTTTIDEHRGYEVEEPSAVFKRRLRTTWNNAKYNNGVSKWVLKRRSSFDKDQPVWLLGKLYSWQSDQTRKISITNPTDNEPVDEAYLAFQADFASRLWFTYRKDFEKLNGCRLRSDCGWGCMLRCGQMLMAQALLCHTMGRDWLQCQDHEDSIKRKWHRQIVEWFVDCPRRPFSVHRLVEMGMVYGKRGGDWYGPASTAMILRDALINRQLPSSSDIGNASSIAALDNFAIFVSSDGVVYLDELEKCTNRRSTTSGDSSMHQPLILDKSLLLIIPLRLGADRCNPVYVYHLKIVLSLKTCVGIIGGRPKHSMYFVGWQRDSLIYLDPHYCQDAVGTMESVSDAELQTFHCKWPRKIAFADMDPSCAVGFYLRSGTNMDDFLGDLMDIIEYKESTIVSSSSSSVPSTKYPLFSVMKQRPIIESRRESLLDDEHMFSGGQTAVETTSDGGGGRRRRRSSSMSALKRDYVVL